MKKYLLTFLLLAGVTFYGTAQNSCSEVISYVKSNSYGTTYSSYNSSAISSVSFHKVTDSSYNTMYFAIVNFKNSYGNYIYQVGSSTESNYARNYQTSAGRAFNEYIYPYSEVLGCGR